MKKILFAALLFCMPFLAYSQTHQCTLRVGATGKSFTDTSMDPSIGTILACQNAAYGSDGTDGACAAELAVAAQHGITGFSCHPNPFDYPGTPGANVCSDGGCTVGSDLCLTNTAFPNVCSTAPYGAVAVIEQAIVSNPLIQMGGVPTVFTLSAGGETGDQPVQDSTPLMVANATRTVTITTSPQGQLQNGAYTYVEFMHGAIVDSLGNHFHPTWTYERVCARACRLDGVMYTTLNVTQGVTYKFVLQGDMVIPNGADTPQYSVHVQ